MGTTTEALPGNVPEGYYDTARIDPDFPPTERLKPADCFSAAEATREDLAWMRGRDADVEETGRESRAVRIRILRSCAGWGKKPTPAEFYDAVRADTPSKRQRSIIRMWERESTFVERVTAWAEGAYTMRQLVHALHAAGCSDTPIAGEINMWARRRTT